ncbi:Aromatase [Actinokineospora spheciospongiae]|uniref:Aromatase n=1 Tax=Actinokineospora spheciospongiae TaxID=909613 RepID=W7IQY5_9PSEU|nr:Aromatase [Actinokineospora spheciospongiae]
MDAAADTLFDLIAEVEQAKRVFTTVIHTEYLRREETSDRVERWSWDDKTGVVRNWRASRTLDRGAGRITFRHENPPAGLDSVTGEWTFKPLSADRTTVELRHDFQAADQQAGERLDRGAATQLAQLARFAADLERIREYEVSYEVELLIPASADELYDYFSDAARWPERIPHCLSVRLSEDVAPAQVVEMDVQVPSGAVHTTKQARICFPGEKVVWRQLAGLPPLDDALFGYMSFTPTEGGVLARAGSTELLKPRAVAKRGWEAQEAKDHVAEVRGGRNLDALNSAAEYLARKAAR